MIFQKNPCNFDAYASHYVVISIVKSINFCIVIYKRCL